MKHPEPKSAKATSGDYGFLLGWLWDLPCNLSGKLRLFVKPALEFYMLGQSLLALPKWPQAYSMKLGSWSLAAKCKSLSGAFGNQLFPIRLGSTWPTFANGPQAYSIRLGLGAWLQNASLC